MSKLFIAVIHEKRFGMRLQTLNNLINKFTSGFKVEIIDKHNIEDLNMDEIRANVKLDNPDTKTFFDQLIRNMHVKQVSQALKHRDALEAFVAQDTFDNMLVIEDDVLCGDNIVTEIDKAIEVLKKNADNVDMLFLGCPTPKPMLEKKQEVAPVSEYFKLLPTCDAYLVSKASAQKILGVYSPIRYQANVHFSFLAQAHNIKIAMMSPNIFVNGSKYGVYVSSVDANNRLFMNQDYNKLVMLNTKGQYTSQEVQDVIDMTNKMSLRDHPDFQYQFGLFFMRIGQVKPAKEFLDNAYRVYTQNDCILNSESEFLLNYTKCFKFLQQDRDEIEEKLTPVPKIK